MNAIAFQKTPVPSDARNVTASTARREVSWEAEPGWFTAFLV
jgi:hypothetical protein